MSSASAEFRHQRWRVCDEICTSRAHRHAPTQVYYRAPTDRSVHCIRSINDFTTLRQQNLTWVGIECRALRAQQDSVSTDRQHQRFASPFHPSRQIDHKRCQNLPETGVPAMISFFPQKGQEKTRSQPHSTPHSMIHLHSTPLHVCPSPHQQWCLRIGYASAIRSVCGFGPWSYCP